MKYKTSAILVLSWIPQWLFLWWCQNHPEWVDRYYSQGLYPWWQFFRTYFVERLVFSFGDLCYLGLFLSVLFFIYSKGKSLFLKPWEYFFQSLGILALIHLFFQLSWGLNYHQSSMASQQNITLEYSEQDLVETIDTLLFRINSLHNSLSKSDSVTLDFPLEKEDYLRLLDAPSAKTSLWSLPLSYMGYAGYLNPFTGEAQVNGRLPTLSFIFTAAHEKAHQQGIAAEEEANFYAFTTTYKHQNSYIRYAAFSFAFRYCWSALHKLQPKRAEIYKQNLHPGIIKEYQQQQDFWMAYQNPLQPLVNKIYDWILKANGQAAGRKSYSQVVALLVANRQKL